MSYFLTDWFELSKTRLNHINSFLNYEADNTDSIIAFASLYVTGNCHLKCQHCYAQDDFGIDTDAKTEQLIKIMSATRKLSSRIQFTGGEPMIRRDPISNKNDIFLLCNAAKKLDFDIIFQTTGMHIKEWMLPIFLENNVSWFSLSLDGSEPKTNSLLRGTDVAWHKTIEVIPLLKNMGFKVKVGTTATSLNFDVSEFQKIGEILRNLNVDIWKITQFYPREAGRSSFKSKDSLHLNDEYFSHLCAEISSKFKNDFSSLTFQTIKDFSRTPALLIAPTGDISVTMGLSDIYIGNIIVDSFDDIKNNILYNGVHTANKRNEERTYI